MQKNRPLSHLARESAVRVLISICAFPVILTSSGMPAVSCSRFIVIPPFVVFPYLYGISNVTRTCVPVGRVAAARGALSGRKAFALRVHFKSAEPNFLCAPPHIQPDHVRHAGVILCLRRALARDIEHRAETFLHRRARPEAAAR